MIDSHGRNITYLRLSVTERCNLRCRYCMPEEGICKKPHEAMLTEDYRQIMTEATHVAGMCKRIYEQAREAMRKKRVAG